MEKEKEVKEMKLGPASEIWRPAKRRSPTPKLGAEESSEKQWEKECARMGKSLSTLLHHSPPYPWLSRHLFVLLIG